MRATKISNQRKTTKKATKRMLTTPSGSTADTLKVRLRPDCTVDYEVVNLRKSAGDRIRWVSEGPAFTIHFDDTPFVDAQGNPKHDFAIAAGGSMLSSPPVLGPARQCDYTVLRPALAMSADPSVSVRP